MSMSLLYIDALIMYLQKVGEAAPNTPMLYYHIPIMTGVKFSMEDLLQAAATDIPTLRGLKFTDENLMEFTRCVACNKGSYPVMYGRDEVRGRIVECTFFCITASPGITGYGW